MNKTKRATERPRWAALRMGEIMAAMGLAMVVGAGFGLAATAADRVWLTPPPVDIGTIENARLVLGSVIGGLMTVAVFGLWMRTVVVGLMASNFSPRTLLTFLDDRFQRHLLASLSAGVVAVMVILLRMPPDPEAAIPLVSAVLAVLIVLATMAAILLAIQHATRSLSLPALISQLADDSLKVLERYPEPRMKVTEVPPLLSAPRTVLAPGTGWVTDIDIDRMRQALPNGGAVHLRCRIGEFVTPRRPVALISLDESDEEADVDAVASAINLARTRDPDVDLAFAVSQLVDVGTFALQARSDTATAHEVMVHLEVVLSEIVDRGLSRLHDRDDDGRCVYDEAGWDAVDLVKLCVERLREPAARDPEAAQHLMQMLHHVREVAVSCEDEAVAAEVGSQVDMVLALADSTGMLSRDLERLTREAEAVVSGDSIFRTGLGATTKR